MIITTDDVCPQNLKFWHHWDEIKKHVPELKLIAFTIANYKGQDVSKSLVFKRWFDEHKDWVEIGVHGYDHESPPEQERDNAGQLVSESVEILQEFLPERFLYRPPGFQRTIYTEPLLRLMGFAGVAYQTRIKMFDGRVLEPVFNTHCCDQFFYPVTQWKKWINQLSF